MGYQGITTGTSPNDGTGDSLLTGALKINSNFQEIYNAIGDGSTIRIDSNGISIFEIASISDLRLSSISDKLTISNGNNIELSYSTGGGNVAFCANPTGPITLNVSNIPTDASFDSRIISFTVIVNQGTTAYACTNITLNGLAFDANAQGGPETKISYLNGAVPTGNSPGYDLFNFIGINTVGSAETTSYYKILSNVTGSYQG